MKSYQLLLALVVIVHVRCSPLDDWHARLYEIAERLDIQESAKDQACKEMLSLELRVVACAHDREIFLRKQAKNKPHLRGYSSSDQHSLLRKQCFDEHLFCGYGIFMYAITSNAHENSLEQFLVHRNVDLAKLTTVEQLRSVIIDCLKIEQLQLFNSIGNVDDVQFGLDYLLAWAAWCGSLDIVQHLVDAGANVVQYGYYAIEAVAASLDDIEIVRNEKCKILHYLINKGAHVTHNACELSQRNCPAGDKIVALLAQHAPLCVIM